MLKTVKFKTKIDKGMITIPEEYQQDLKEDNEIQVILIEQTDSHSESENIDTPIWEIFEEAADNLPNEIIAELPTDGSSQHDHYLYGSPKK